MLNIHVQANDGKKISEKDADMLTELKVFLPEDCNAFKHQIKIFAVVLKLVADEKAYAYRKIKEWVEVIEENEASYMEAQKNDRLIFIRILYVIHSRFQMYLRNCRQRLSGDLEPELLNFNQLRKYLLVEGCRVNLPDLIMKEVKNRDKRRWLVVEPGLEVDRD